jgi:hypothetical protein
MIAGGIHKFLQTNYAIFQHSGHPIVVVKGAKFIQDFRTNPLFLEAPPRQICLRRLRESLRRYTHYPASSHFWIQTQSPQVSYPAP